MEAYIKPTLVVACGLLVFVFIAVIKSASADYAKHVERQEITKIEHLCNWSTKPRECVKTRKAARFCRSTHNPRQCIKDRLRTMNETAIRD